MLSQVKKKLLIIGTLPPPVGGVTIYTLRLLSNLAKSDIAYEFIDVKRCTLKLIWGAFFRSHIIHIHTSNVLFRLFGAVLFPVMGKQVFITYHGSINRYGRFKNFLDRLSVKAAKLPIVINGNSYAIAKKINKSTVIVSAFIPPDKIIDLNKESEDQIDLLKSKCTKLFCTNAYNVSYDKENNEIYQISGLVELFNKNPSLGLVISDPSAKYHEFFLEKKIRLESNIILLPFIHDFNAVLRKSDCLIRFTTTDGDSLSVKEALALGKQVIATNVVNRPKEVILVDRNMTQLKKALDSISIHTLAAPDFDENGFSQMYDIYKIYQL